MKRILDGHGIDNDVKVYPGVGHSFMSNHPGKLATLVGAAGRWLEPGNVKANLVSQTFANALLSALADPHGLQNTPIRAATGEPTLHPRTMPIGGTVRVHL